MSLLETFAEDYAALKNQVQFLQEQVNGMQDTQKRVLNSREAAEFTGLTENTIRQYARLGKIPCSKRAKKYTFDRTILENWALDRN